MRLVLKQGRVIILDELVIVRVSPLTSRADLPHFFGPGIVGVGDDYVSLD